MARISRKSPAALSSMRDAGRIVAQTIDLVRKEARPSVTTQALDVLAEQYIRDCGALPAFKGYRGYPATLCTCINDEVVHGIPGRRKLEEGDLLSIDVGAFKDGYAGDAAVTLAIGSCSEEAMRLVRITQQALARAIETIRAGVRVADISQAIQAFVESNGFSVVRQYTGHGIGRELHEAPQVPNYVARGSSLDSPVLPEGATVAIEPMVNAGGHETKTARDGWTVRTKDGSLSAHFEHTVAVERAGALILTLP